MSWGAVVQAREWRREREIDGALGEVLGSPPMLGLR